LHYEYANKNDLLLVLGTAVFGPLKAKAKAGHRRLMEANYRAKLTKPAVGQMIMHTGEGSSEAMVEWISQGIWNRAL
jgi:hypothetical protein